MSPLGSPLHAIVPAGGAGTRLWPLSRAGHPKFLLDLTGSGRSLLQQTWDRLVRLVGAERVHVITGHAHRDAVSAQLPDLDPAHLVAEPSPRDSMPAIGLVAALIHRNDPDAVVASFAADHLIGDQEVFEDAVRKAVEAAQSGYVATIGITPTSPSTAFGYVESGKPLAEVEGVRLVTRFVEKPDLTTAARYLESGAFRWNAGMFVARTDVLLGHLSAQQPRLAEGIDAIADAWDTDARGDVLARVWPTLTKIAIDHAIAEPVGSQGGIAMVPGEFDWTDVGDFGSVSDLLGPADSLRVLGDSALVAGLESTGLVVTSGRTVSVVGLDDVVVVDTPDALLVTTRDHAQRVKQVVERWRAAGRDDLL